MHAGDGLRGGEGGAGGRLRGVCARRLERGGVVGRRRSARGLALEGLHGGGVDGGGAARV